MDTAERFEVIGNHLMGTEQVMEDGETYRQIMPGEMCMIMVKEGTIMFERLPDGRYRYRYTVKNIFGRVIKTLETCWKRVEKADSLL
jgi:hypothetical protein